MLVNPEILHYIQDFSFDKLSIYKIKQDPEGVHGLMRVKLLPVPPDSTNLKKEVEECLQGYVNGFQDEIADASITEDNVLSKALCRLERHDYEDSGDTVFVLDALMPGNAEVGVMALVEPKNDAEVNALTALTKEYGYTDTDISSKMPHVSVVNLMSDCPCFSCRMAPALMSMPPELSSAIMQALAGLADDVAPATVEQNG